MPGCAGWAGGLCQPRREPGEGSGAVTGHLHDAGPHSVVLKHHPFTLAQEPQDFLSLHAWMTGTPSPGALKA